jgi:hypothetical protein
MVENNNITEDGFESLSLENQIKTLKNALERFFEMNYERQTRMEKNIDDLYRLSELHNDWLKIHQDRLENYFDVSKNIKYSVDWHNEAIPELQQATEKGLDVYYHVFPERLGQDAKLREQIKTLMTKRRSDDDPKKS